MNKKHKIPEIPIDLQDHDALKEIKKYLGKKYIEPKVRMIKND